MKINHKITIGLGLCALVFASGCNLDRFPYDSITSKGDIDAGSIETMTLGNYAKMKEEYFFKTIHQYGEYGGDNISLSGPTSDNLAYCYRYERVPNNHYPARLWEFTYSILININKLIPTIEAAPSSEAVDHLLGENYFLRSLLYFHCCNVFCRPYLDTNGAENNLGLPIKVTDDANYFPARSSVKDVYAQILKDATKAAKLMERTYGKPKSNINATQEAAWALLSRVYLYMGEWETAGKYCDSVIASNRFNLLQGEVYKNYPRQTPETNTETIYSIRMTKDVDYEKYFMAEYSVGAMYSRINEEGWGEMNPSESYLNLLRKNPQDLRFGFIEDQLVSAGGMWMIYVVGNETAKTFDYKTNAVQQQPDGSWKITEGASTFTSPTVQKQTLSDGSTQYYVTTAAGGVRYDVWIEPVCEKRDGVFPKRYIMKCSLQEGQAQLYSPVMFRLAEMYLTRAECRYRAGDYQGALDDVNVIRKRAGIPERTLAQTGNPSVDVLTWVLDERRLELAWEGHRRYDVFRNQLTLNRRYPGAHLTGAAATVFLDVLPSDPRIAEFIPQKEIDAYPGNALVQNP